jgi:UDP:flavonoid glycosyltransferase YjiC (YdhE family)
LNDARRRILFVAEDLTLAQVVRLAALAERLDRRHYEIHFACREFAPLVFSRLDAVQWPLPTVEKEAALKRLAKGERMYDEKTLIRYVESELALFEKVNPDLVIGDFRLSLSVSAPYAKVPLATLINAYWSPFAVRESFPVPDHPIVSLIGAERAARYMPQALPKAFAFFGAPLSAVRRKFGLSALDSLLEQLTFGDLTLHPDVPELCPTRGAPDHHVYLGAIPWSPNVPLPGFWKELRDDIPTIYVTLGSSGSVTAVPAVVEALADLPVQVLLASAGRLRPDRLPPNTHLAEYLPGDLAARRSSVVVTNGGSSTGYQALTEGVPVLGVPFNMDQYLAMTAIAAAGAGVLVRAGTVSAREVRRGILRILDNAAFSRAAVSLRDAFAAYDCFERFSATLSRAFGVSTSASGDATFTA